MAGEAIGTRTHDKLIGGDHPLVTSSEVLLDGQTVARGGILGRITAGAVPTTGTADGGNTGDGTVTAVTGGVDAKAGIYNVACIEAFTNGGTFKVVDPDGIIVGTANIAVGAGGTAVFTSSQINLTITDGATDFALDDFFTITVPAGSGKMKLIDSTAIDGSGKPYAVSTEAAAPSGADATISAFLSGQFNIVGLSVGGSDTVAQHKDEMRKLSMYQRASVPE
jgi:hypothetical protein